MINLTLLYITYVLTSDNTRPNEDKRRVSKVFSLPLVNPEPYNSPVARRKKAQGENNLENNSGVLEYYTTENIDNKKVPDVSYKPFKKDEDSSSEVDRIINSFGGKAVKKKDNLRPKRAVLGYVDNDDELKVVKELNKENENINNIIDEDIKKFVDEDMKLAVHNRLHILLKDLPYKYSDSEFSDLIVSAIKSINKEDKNDVDVSNMSEEEVLGYYDKEIDSIVKKIEEMHRKRFESTNKENLNDEDNSKDNLKSITNMLLESESSIGKNNIEVSSDRNNLESSDDRNNLESSIGKNNIEISDDRNNSESSDNKNNLESSIGKNNLESLKTNATQDSSIENISNSLLDKNNLEVSDKNNSKSLTDKENLEPLKTNATQKSSIENNNLQSDDQINLLTMNNQQDNNKENIVPEPSRSKKIKRSLDYQNNNQKTNKEENTVPEPSSSKKIKRSLDNQNNNQKTNNSDLLSSASAEVSFDNVNENQDVSSITTLVFTSRTKIPRYSFVD